MKIFRLVLFLVTCFCSQAYAAEDGNYPAAYFTPKVIYQDPVLIEELAGSDNIEEPTITAKTILTPTNSGSNKTANPEQTEKYTAAYQSAPIVSSEIDSLPLEVLGLVAVLLLVLFWTTRREAKTEEPGLEMALINRVLLGESLQGDGNEVAHIDLMIGPRGSAVESAFANALTNNKDGFSSLLAVVAPNLMAKPPTVMFNKVTIKGAKQAVQMFGPAQRGVAMAVADCVEDGTIPADEADDVFICVGVFIHWLAEDDAKIQDYNYAATKESIKRAVARQPKARDVVTQKGSAEHPFAAHA